MCATLATNWASPMSSKAACRRPPTASGLSCYDACAYSVLTPYPGTLTWYEMKKADRIVSYDWEKYDQANVVYRPARMTGDELRLGQTEAYETFYSPSSMAQIGRASCRERV